MNIKRRYKRIISIILVLSMLITNLAGCGNGNQNASQNPIVNSASDAVSSNINNDLAEESTSVLSKEEIEKIEDISADFTTESTVINDVLDSIVADSENAGDNIDKLGTLLDSSASSVDDWIELQNELSVSVSDDLSVEAAALLETRKNEEAAKLQENVKSAETKYAELKSAYDAGENEKVTDIAEELSEMFDDEIQSYGTDAEEYANSVMAQNLDCPVSNIDIDNLSETNNYFQGKFKNPLEAYEYLKNNIYTEFSYGRKKNVISTYESKCGNDYDQAVLLATILQSMGYETKYVRGNIVLTPEMALSMTGTDNPDIAANIIAMAGIPVTKLKNKDGSIKGIKIEHVWVRANIPYTDYRGAGNVSGDKVWIDLDTSIKLYEEVDKSIYGFFEDDEVYRDIKLSFDNENYTKGYNLINENSIISAERICNESQEVYNRKRIISEETIEYLPLSLQYEVDNEIEVTNDLNISDNISIIVSGESLGTYSTAYLSDKSVVISFAPVDSNDEEILNAYGNIFNVSANSVYVKPVLYIDGNRVSEAEYTEYPLGTSTKIGLTLSYAGNYTEKSRYIENNAISGSIYALTVDDSAISNYELQKVTRELRDRKYYLNENNVFNLDNIGNLLAFSGKFYFAQLDAMDILVSEKANVADIRCLSEAITGYEMNRKLLFGMVTKLEYGSLFIDVDSDNHAVVSRDGDKNKEVIYRYNIGCIGSMCEGLIWSETREENNKDSVSTISILGKAREEGIEIITLRKENLDDLSILNDLNLDQSELNRINNDLESGKIITIPTKNVKIGEWNGTGYISLDPDTGVGTYKISGGLSGGVDPVTATAATIMAAFATVLEIIVGNALMDSLLALSIPGPVGTIIALGGCVLLAAGIVVWQTMMYAYIEYMAYGGEDNFNEFITWFQRSCYMTAIQAFYTVFVIMVDTMYRMLCDGSANTGNTGNTGTENAGNQYQHKQNLEGLERVRQHLTSDVDGMDYKPNQRMLELIEEKLRNGESLTGAYKDFYEHELTEMNLMEQGYDYNTAHEMALEIHNVCPQQLYSPEVVSELSKWFNKLDFEYWGIDHH